MEFLKTNNITDVELKERLSWTFEQKEFHLLDVVSVFLHYYPNAVAMFSGGIDSTMLLHAMRRIKADVVGKFGNTTNEFADILRFVKQTPNIEIVNPKINFKECIEKFGFPLISKKNARMINDCRHPTGKNDASINLYMTGIRKDGQKGKFIIPKSLRYLLDVPFDITHKCCTILKHNPLGNNNCGACIGTMATDSNMRKESYKKTGCINYGDNTCRPLSIFTKKDIWEYQKRYNVPYTTIYDKGETNTGCAYCGMGLLFDRTRYDRVKKLEPKRFEEMMEIKNNGIRFIEAIQMVLSKPKRVSKF